jgi:iron complex transport system substrate-binding protein
MRIASLIPSGTDIAIFLGLQSNLVGVSHCCDHPAVADLPVLTFSKVPSHQEATPLEVDVAVCETVSSGDSLYLTHRTMLEELRPDWVLSQDICDVCAVTADQASCDLPAGAGLLMLSAISLAGLWDDLERVGRATGTLARAQQGILELQNRLEEIARRVQGKIEGNIHGKARPRVLALEWSDPPFLGGHWIPELVEYAGASHVLSGSGEASRRSSWDEIAAADPEIIVFMPCGYTLQEAEQEAGRLFAICPEFANLRAVRRGQFWISDATRLFSRCTPVSIRACEILAGIVHGVYPLEPSEVVQFRPNLGVDLQPSQAQFPTL